MNKFLTYANRIARNTIENKDIHHAKDIFIPDDDYNRGHKLQKQGRALYYDPWTTATTILTPVLSIDNSSTAVVLFAYFPCR